MQASVLYVVRRKPEADRVLQDADDVKQWFLFRPVVLSSREQMLEGSDISTKCRKLFFLGWIWDRLSPQLIEALFGEEREPTRMFDRSFEIERHDMIIGVDGSSYCASPDFLKVVQIEGDEDLKEYVQYLEERNQRDYDPFS